MITKNEKITTEIHISGDQARKQILDLKNSIEAETATVKKLKVELQSLETLQQKDSALYKEKKAALDAANNSIKSNRNRIKELTESMKVQDLTMKELKDRIRETSAQLNKMDPNTKEWKEMSARLRDANARLKQLKDTTQQTSGILRRLWNSASGAVAIIHVGIRGMQRLASSIIQATETMAEFEQANANLSTILGKNVSEIGQLTDSALQLGRTTEYTASQVTSLQTELAKLGFNENQIQAMQESVLHFATAVGTDLASAAKLAGSTLRIFGLTAADTEEVLSTLTVGTNKSALSFSYLETAMSIAGPVARTFGFSVKDTTALLGTLANAGFDASSAATATRNIILNLANASGKLAKKLGEPVKTFPELMDALKKLNEQGIDLATTLEITDKRSVSAFNAFLRGADDALVLRDSLEEVDGELERIADERMNTMEGSIKLLKSAWEGFILTMRNSVGPIKWAIDQITKLINGLSDYMDPEGAARRQADARINPWLDRMVKLDQSDFEKYKAEALRIYQEAADAYGQALAAYNNKKNKANRKALDEAILERQAAWTAYDRAISSYTAPGSVDGSGSDGTGGTGGSGGKGGGSKNKKSWSLKEDEGYLSARAELIRQYNEGEIASQAELDERLYQLAISTYQARLAAQKDFGADRAKIENDMQDTTMKYLEAKKKLEKEADEKTKKRVEEARDLILSAETDKTKAALAAEEKRYRAELEKWKGYVSVQEALEKKHQIAIAKIQFEGIQEETAILKSEYEEKRATIEKGYQKLLNDSGVSAHKRLDAQKRLNKDLLQAEIDHLRDLLALQRKFLDETEGLSKEQVATISAKIASLDKQLSLALERMANADLSSTSYTSVQGRGSLFGISQDDWELFFHNIDKGKTSLDDLQFAFNAIGGAATEGFKLAQQAIQLTNAKEEKALKEYQESQDKKKEALQKRFDAGLMTQAQYDAEVKRLETEQEAYEEELALNKAKREKALNLSQAIINTALAVMKTFTSFGGWPAGVAPAAIMGAIGAAQVAMIAATPVTGKEEGGPFEDDVVVRRKQDGKRFKARYDPDKRGFVSRPTVLAGENGTEYVIPAEGIANPSLLPFINTIETARQHGKLRNLNLAAVYPSGSVPGRASGGFVVSGEDSPSGVSDTGSSLRDPELLTVLQKLSEQLDKPIEAVVALLGPKGLLKALDEYDRSRSRGSIL